MGALLATAGNRANTISNRRLSKLDFDVGKFCPGGVPQHGWRRRADLGGRGELKLAPGGGGKVRWRDGSPQNAAGPKAPQSDCHHKKPATVSYTAARSHAEVMPETGA